MPAASEPPAATDQPDAPAAPAGQEAESTSTGRSGRPEAAEAADVPPPAGRDAESPLGPVAAAEAPPPAAVGGALDWTLVVLITLLTGLVGLVGLAFLPWYIGPVPMPVSALLGVGAMILGPRACYRLTGSFVAAVLPVASWFVVSVWLALLRNPMMPSVAVTVVQGQWRVMLLLGLGSLAAAATLTLLWAERARAGLVVGSRDDAAALVGSAGGTEPDEPPVRSP